MPYVRRRRTFMERLPGKGNVVSSRERGRDAPPTRRDELFVVGLLVAILAIGCLVAIVWAAAAVLGR